MSSEDGSGNSDVNAVGDDLLDSGRSEATDTYNNYHTSCRACQAGRRRLQTSHKRFIEMPLKVAIFFSVFYSIVLIREYFALV